MATRTHRLAIACASLLLATPIFTPATLAADVVDIGFVDQAALSNIRQFTDANRQLAGFKSDLDKQFAKRMRSVRDGNTQQRIAQEFQNKLGERQRALFGPLLARAQVAIASVASSKNLSVVVDAVKYDGHLLVQRRDLQNLAHDRVVHCGNLRQQE